MDMLMSVGITPILQVVISGVAFGLAHTCWMLARGDFKFMLPAVLSTTVLGILLAIIYLIGGRNLGPSIFAHGIINMIIEPWLMLSSISGKWRPNHNTSD
jgi:membrane protease YdiL (CAAX protease family)